MESLLAVVAAVSLALAGIMSTVAWRLLRDNHHRTATRAEALMALLQTTGSLRKSSDPDADGSRPVARKVEVAQATASSSTPMAVQAPARPVVADISREPDSPPAKQPRAATAAVIDGPLHDSPVSDRRGDSDNESSWDRAELASRAAPDPFEPVAATTMFESDHPRQMSMGRLLSLAAAGLVILIGAGTVYALNTGSWLSSFTGGDEREEMVAASARQPLELLSLKHGTDEGGAFVVTGLVQNPIEGASLRGVVATVYLFDHQGRYFASGRARLDVSTLGPGEESPFVVKVPHAAAVGRYRVGFRLDDGGVVAHVDRRGQSPAGTSGDTIDDERRPSVATPAATPRRSEG